MNPTILTAIQKIRSLLTRQQKIHWAIIVGFALLSGLLEVLTTFVIVIFAQVLTQPNLAKLYFSKMRFESNMNPIRGIFYIALGFGFIFLLKNSISAIEAFYQNKAIQKMNYQFKHRFLKRFSKIDYSIYLTRNSSHLLTVFGSDIERIFSTGIVALANVVSEGIIFICLIVMVVGMNPSLALVIFFIGSVLTWILIKWALPLFYQWGQKYQEANILTCQHLMQFLHAFKEIVLFGKQNVFIGIYQEHAMKQSKIFAIQSATNALPRIIIESVFVALFIITISYMCFQHNTPQKMIGILGGYLYVGFRLMPSLNRIIGQLNNFKSAIPNIERVYAEYSSVAEKMNYQCIPQFSFENSIQIHDLSFRYQNIDNRNTLNNINITIKKGEKIGIVGETGSGKSTLVDIFLGLLYPDKGHVTIDGKFPVRSKQWHEIIGYVPQFIYLMDDSIEANIAFGVEKNRIDNRKINQVIEDSQLKTLIERLPEGIKTVVGERGVRLSGGERQRIAIARALYRDPEVLIFDEATSALDSEIETRLMQTIYSVSRNRTVIMVAHRVTTLQDCDRIIIIKHGEIEDITTYTGLSNKHIYSAKV